ncbi:MAG: SDR family NAD(P)-dependent oxidoreductase [Chloroflexota bacterium]
MSNIDLQDRVVLITGAGKGAGRALAETLSAYGAVIAANDISPVNVEEVVAGIKAKGGNAKAYIEDVAKKVAVQALIKTIEDELGRIDVLIVHAAVEPHTPLLAMDEWDWHRVLDVNLTGAFLMIQSVGRVMRASSNRRGVMLTIVPGAGRERHPEPVEGVRSEAGAYASSMEGLRALSHAADRELSQFGVRVYAIENEGNEKVVEAALSILEKEAQ